MPNKVPQGHHRDYTKEEVKKAIEGSCGVVNEVAKKLSCHWLTARKYINKWKETQELMKTEREVGLDLAETTVFDAIKGGDVNTAKWLLNIQARSRGYSDKQTIEHTGPEGEPLSIQVNLVGNEKD